MPVTKCGGCGRQTNSCTSNYWTRNGKPTQCVGAFVDGKWAKGCFYKEASQFEQEFVDGLILRTKSPPGGK